MKAVVTRDHLVSNKEVYVATFKQFSFVVKFNTYNYDSLFYLEFIRNSKAALDLISFLLQIFIYGIHIFVPNNLNKFKNKAFLFSRNEQKYKF